MEETLLQSIYEWFKKFSPYILVGTIGAVVHRLRNNMPLRTFISSVIISILVSLSVGVVCQEYTELKDNVIFVLCGISGTFSKLLLDEIEEIIADLSVFARQRMGLKDKSKKEDNKEFDQGGQDIPDER